MNAAAGRASSARRLLSRPAWQDMLGLFLFALCVRLLVIALTRFDGLYGQDAFAYLDYTQQILKLHLVGPFYWPLGYPILAAIVSLPVGNADLGAQAASILFGSALSVLVYALITEVLAAENMGQERPEGGRVFALRGGLIIAMSGQVIESSIVIMSDIPGLFWATLSAYALIRTRNSNQWFPLPLSAASLAFAIITRWVYAGLILPYGIYFLVQHRALIRSARVACAIALFLVIVLWQVTFSQSTAAPVLQQSLLVEWNPLNAGRTVFDNPDGHFEYPSPPLIFDAGPFFQPFYLFPLLALLIFPGAWKLRRSRELVLLGGWILTDYIYLIGIPYENFRFGLAFFPPIVIVLAIGCAALPRPLSPRAVSPHLLCILASLPLRYH